MEDRRAKTLPRILIVDDEVLILKALARSLRRDHEVTCAEGGVAAFRLLKSAAEPFDAILCDLRMPDMSGQALHAKILKTAPAAARSMIFLAGDLRGEAANGFLSAIPNPRFEKPVEMGELRASIKAVAEWSGE